MKPALNILQKSTERGDDVKVAKKAKTLFDHIKQIREVKNKNYFSTLTDADSKTWNNYMICRFLSMDPELIESINELQYYQDKLTPEQFYQLCIEIVPRSRKFHSYIKNTAEKYDKGMLNLLCSHFKDSERNVLAYINIMSHEDLMSIVKMYGYSETEAKKLCKK